MASQNCRKSGELAKYLPPKPKTPTGRCRLPFWLGGNLDNPEVIEIDCEGNVTLCPGISIGNAKRQSLAQILENYDCLDQPILSIIADEGPTGLLKIAGAKGFKENQKFVNECHLCYETRKFLSPHYPTHLAPANCY